MKALLSILALLFSLALPAHAEQFGLFTYRVNDGKVTITGYPEDATGHVEIPAEIAGLPVTSIGWFAFRDCTGLTSVTIPGSVTNIGRTTWRGITPHVAFSGLTGLTEINVSPLNSSYSSLDGVLFNKNKTTLIRYPEGRSGAYTIPEGVQKITGYYYDYEDDTGYYGYGGAFENCINLTSVTIPASVTSIAEFAFRGCVNLHSAIFIGNAPPTFPYYPNYFTNTAPNFTISYLPGSTGFTSPTWHGYQTVMIDESAYPAASWLLTHGLSYDTDLDQDLNGDGVSLLTAYALNIDPHRSYRSLDGVIFHENTTTLVRHPVPGSGEYLIPDGITQIGENAFFGCTGLTSITIPDSVTSISQNAFSGCTALISIIIPDRVTSIGEYVFSGCTGLTEINVSPRNSIYSSLDGILFNKNKTTLIRFPEGKSGAYTVPDGVQEIAGGYMVDSGDLFEGETVFNIRGEGAFADCQNLISVTIPASVESVGMLAFSGCSALQSAIFLGEAPTFDFFPFALTAPGLTIFYLSGSTGFTSPIWQPVPPQSYPSVMIDESVYPAASWLLTNGLSHDTDLDQDLNGDSVSLRTAYALNLDPNQNLSGSLPRPIVGADSLSLRFHATAPGITYTVETSTDLVHWTTEGVTWSEGETEGYRTASVERDNQRRFLRLLVSVTD